VLLSGTGADDIFTGYRRHQAVRFDQFWSFLPGGMRRGIAGAAKRLPTGSTGMRRIRKLLESVDGSSSGRLARVFEWLSPDAAAALMTGQYAASADSVRAPLLAELDRLHDHSPVERVLRLDQRFFLIDHNLNYTDKTGMAEGVEIRVPFLDPDLMAWAARVPVKAKMRGGTTKWVLRKAMEPILPREIIYRPKTGFGVPLRSWLRNGMRPMMEELLSPASVNARGLFDPAALGALKQRTLAGQQDGSYALLGLMAIELWCRRFVDA
jgi:asparagine synthase (glutamine-hydrolysing)